MKEDPFRPLAESFRHAAEGLSYVYLTQRNMRVHLFATALVGWGCILFGLSRVEVLMVVLAVAGVLLAEVVNTLAESLIDLLSPAYNPLAKTVKDVAAAGVLISSIFAVAIGAVAFVPALLDAPQRLGEFLDRRLGVFIAYAVVVVVPPLAGLFFVEFRMPRHRGGI